MVYEVLLVAQTPKNLTDKEKFTEIVTVIDTVNNQRKCIGSIPINQSKHTNENVGMYKSILSSGINKIAVNEKLGIICSSQSKPLIYNFKIKERKLVKGYLF